METASIYVSSPAEWQMGFYKEMQWKQPAYIYVSTPAKQKERRRRGKWIPRQQ
jgi:hypothetical protein